MTQSMVENISKVKQVFIEESQNHIRELKEKILTLDIGHPKFYQHLDFLIVTNSLLRESAVRANFAQLDQPFLVTSQRFDQSINLMRDRYGDIDWIVKGLLLEAIDLLDQIINAYCLDLAIDSNWMVLQSELFRKIEAHLNAGLDDDKLVQIESLESGDRDNDEPFTLDNGTENENLFDDDLSQESIIDLLGSDQELHTLFPSLVSEPFDGELEDLLDFDISDQDLRAEDIAPLPMPEMLVDIFEESKSETLLGNDDETELQGFNWNSLEEIAEKTSEEYESIDNIWNEISSLESWSEMGDEEASALQELEASFDLQDDLVDQIETINQIETVEEQESIRPKFETPEIDTGLEESPIYHSFSPLNLSDLKGSALTTDEHTIKTPLSFIELLGDLSEELSVRKSGLDVCLEELQTLSAQARQSVGLLDSEAVANKSAIAQMQQTLDKLSNMLDLTTQQADAMNQDIRHLHQYLRQSLKHSVSSLVSKFPRLLQNLSSVHGKQVELILQGAEVGIERSLSEPVADVLETLLRKAFKHGIETPHERQQLGKSIQAKISITATQTNLGIVIVVSDNGRGIDIPKIRKQVEQSAVMSNLSRLTTADMDDRQIVDLIFEPNFHDETPIYPADATKLSDIRQKLRAIGGKISVQTQFNQGTEFTISFPNPLSLIRVLLIDINRIPMALPSQLVLDVLPAQSNGNFRDNKSLRWRDREIPIIKLNALLKSNSPQRTTFPQRQTSGFMPNTLVPSLLVIQHEENLFALLADGCWHDQEATFHQIEGDIALPQIFIGSVILSNNQAVALLNVAEIVNQCWRSHTGEQILVPNNWVDSEQSENLLSNKIDNLSSLSDFFGEVSSFDFPESNSVNSQPNHQENPEKTIQNIPKSSRVLIVESSANVRRYLAMTLSKSGFVTEQAQDCKEAIALLKQPTHLNIDVVITDLEMPQMDGFKVLTDIRADAALQHLPVVVLTSRNNDHDQKLAKELGATAYFSKPYREQELIFKLQELVR